MPEISVLIPYYNDEDFLEESIQSVLNQTYTDFELVLINHACTDSSRAIAHSFSDERIVHVDLPTNAGAGGGVILDAFLKVAKGRYLKLFCADDVLHEDYLENVMEYMKENPHIDFCFCNEAYIDRNGKILPSDFYTERTMHIVKSKDWNFAALLDYFHAVSNLPFSSCFIKKECFDGIEIDFTIVMLFDMSIWLQMLLAGKNIGFMPETLVSYRIHEGQISSSVYKASIVSMSFFEHTVFLDTFFRTDNIAALQKLLSRSDISNLQTLRLELAKCYLAWPVITFQLVAYRYLHKYFQQEENRNDDRYTIAQFRGTYKHSSFANRALEPIKDLNGLGIKGTFRLLIKKIRAKWERKKKPVLGHI